MSKMIPFFCAVLDPHVPDGIEPVPAVDDMAPFDQDVVGLGVACLCDREGQEQEACTPHYVSSDRSQNSEARSIVFRVRSNFLLLTSDLVVHFSASCQGDRPRPPFQTAVQAVVRAAPGACRRAVQVAVRYSPMSRSPDIVSPDTLPRNR